MSSNTYPSIYVPSGQRIHGTFEEILPSSLGNATYCIVGKHPWALEAQAYA